MQVKEYLKFGVVQNAVNLPSMTYEEYQEVSPYILMAERLGAFLAPLAAGNLESIHLSYSGRLSQGKTELVRNAAIQGAVSYTHLDVYKRQGMYSSITVISAASFAASSGRLPLVNCSMDSFRCLINVVNTWIACASVTGRRWSISLFFKAAFTMRRVDKRSTARCLIASTIS